MLEEVRITGLGVIEDAVLEFSPGFTVVTGETGAGKTMVVTGLGLMFGGRADPARVRPGADRATVDGRLRIEADGPAAQQVLDAGGELDDDGRTLIVSSATPFLTGTVAVSGFVCPGLSIIFSNTTSVPSVSRLYLTLGSFTPGK